MPPAEVNTIPGPPMRAMNHLYRTLTLSVLAILGACKSSAPASEADATTSAMATYRAEMAKSISVAKSMITAMNAVVTEADKDPRPAFGSFTQEISSLEAQAARTRASRDAMRAQGQSYFQNWEAQLAQITNPEIKKRVEARKAELSTKYGKIREYTDTLAENAQTFMANVKDLHKALSVDLSPAGIKGSAGLIKQFSTEGNKVIQQAEGAMKVVDEVAAVLQVKVAPPPPPAEQPKK